jgi:transposase InsO family protein
MLMRRAGIRGLPGRKRRKTVHETPTALDLVDRKFAREEPNQLWVTDIERHEALVRREAPMNQGGVSPSRQVVAAAW